MTTLEIAWARRVPTFRNRCSRSAASGTRIRSQQLVRAGPPSAGSAGQKSIAGDLALPGRCRPAPDGIRASRTGSVSPAGEALITLPPRVPRFWICAAPMVAAASDEGGQVSRQAGERRRSV